MSATRQIALCFVSHRSADMKLEGEIYTALWAIAKGRQLGRDCRARNDAVEMHKATEQMVIGNDRDTLKKINAERAVPAANSESANRLHETTMAREKQDMLVPCVF